MRVPQAMYAFLCLGILCENNNNRQKIAHYKMAVTWGKRVVILGIFVQS